MKSSRHEKSSFLVIFALLFFLGVCFSGAAEGSFWTQAAEKKAGGDVAITNETIAKLAEKMKPAVVNISTTMLNRPVGPIRAVVLKTASG